VELIRTEEEESAFFFFFTAEKSEFTQNVGLALSFC
jgi:hypothetical protein